MAPLFVFTVAVLAIHSAAGQTQASGWSAPDDRQTETVRVPRPTLITLTTRKPLEALKELQAGNLVRSTHGEQPTSVGNTQAAANPLETYSFNQRQPADAANLKVRAASEQPDLADTAKQPNPVFNEREESAANLGRYEESAANLMKRPAAGTRSTESPDVVSYTDYVAKNEGYASKNPRGAGSGESLTSANIVQKDEDSDEDLALTLKDFITGANLGNRDEQDPEAGMLRIDPRRAGPAKPPSAVCRTRYLYHPEEADWEGAKSICEIEGGQLAIITSEREQGRIASRFGKLREFWIGATDIEREGQFRWVNGQGLGFARWYRSQPNKKYPNTEHCVSFNYWGKDTKWGDRNCYDSRPFLCETMVCKPVGSGRFPGGRPKGPLRKPYTFPRNQNFPGPRGMQGYATRQWPQGRGFAYNDWQRIRTPINV